MFKSRFYLKIHKDCCCGYTDADFRQKGLKKTGLRNAQ